MIIGGAFNPDADTALNTGVFPLPLLYSALEVGLRLSPMILAFDES